MPHTTCSTWRCISIHALREEGDYYGNTTTPSCQQFLSTPSARRATGCTNDLLRLYEISIHALREEGDQMQDAKTTMPEVFLSTPSARRATNSFFNDFVFL